MGGQGRGVEGWGQEDEGNQEQVIRSVDNLSR